MAPEDEEKIVFVTEKGLYGYKVMLFRLKNVGAPYQRLVTKVFKDQINRNIEVYVDDMMVKSIEIVQHMNDLEGAFSVLRRDQMKPNPIKCTFGVTSDKFLDFMVTR